MPFSRNDKGDIPVLLVGLALLQHLALVLVQLFPFAEHEVNVSGYKC